MSKKNEKDYPVGYGKAPSHTRWQKGKSGNPKGRPKKSKNISTLLSDVLSKPVTIRENGQTRTIPFREAWVQKMAYGVLHGSTRDQIALLAAFDKYVPEAINPDPPWPTEMTVRYVMPDGKTLADYGLEEPSSAPEDDDDESWLE